MSKMSALLATLKGKVIVAAAGAVITTGVIVGVTVYNNSMSRTIVANEIVGSVTATGVNKNGDLFVGEHLEGGDYVKVASASNLTLCADNSKFLYADEKTGFKIESKGKDPTKNMVIVMDSGSTLHELKVKLSSNDSYQVDTPSSTMSVRGTTFRVTVYTAADGLAYTLVEVTEGEVVVKLKTEDGTYTGVEESFGPGTSALTRGNNVFSEFVPGNSGDTWILDYDSLPEESVERLIALLKDAKHEHVMSDWEITLEPTCETAGTKAKKCLVCGQAMETEEIAALGHTQGEWDVIKEPTCEDKGEEVIKCKVCGNVLESKEIDALGHKESEWNVTKEPGCETEGAREKKCEVCGKVYESEKIKATGHEYGDWAVVTAPGCTTEGSEKHVCSVCGKEETRTVAAKGHDYSMWTVEAEADCTSDGLETRTCLVCGYEETDVIGATGHTWVEESQAPTCTVAGWTHEVCSRCHAERNQTVVAALGHDLVRQNIGNGYFEWCTRCDYNHASN